MTEVITRPPSREDTLPDQRSWGVVGSCAVPDLRHLTLSNGLDVAFLAAGDDGPLALCLHGFPDTAHSWRHLLPELAAAGFRAVAPFNRGYAPSGLAPDGAYQCGALGADANLLHEALGGDADAVIVGHDWGGLATYAATGVEPDRWRRAITMAVPPGPALMATYFSYEQIRLSWYQYFFQSPFAEMAVAADDHRFIANLWRDWSPGYDATEDLRYWHESMPDDERLSAAIACYRHTLGGTGQLPEYEAEQTASLAAPAIPTLYLHGRTDGCMSVASAELAGAVMPVEGSRAEILDGVGHFLHLEDPGRVDALILAFLTA